MLKVKYLNTGACVWLVYSSFKEKRVFYNVSVKFTT